MPNENTSVENEMVYTPGLLTVIESLVTSGVTPLKGPTVLKSTFVPVVAGIASPLYSEP